MHSNSSRAGRVWPAFLFSQNARNVQKEDSFCPASCRILKNVGVTSYKISLSAQMLTATLSTSFADKSLQESTRGQLALSS